MSATTRAVRSNLVRAGYGFKSAEGKKDAMTGQEKARRTKWDKRFFILSDVNPACVFWYKNESAFMADKEPKGQLPLDFANVELEDGEDKFEGQTVLTVSSPDRNLIMRFMNRFGFESEGTDWFNDIEQRCATGDVVQNAVSIQARFRARPEQRKLGEAKKAAGKIQAMARGEATRKMLMQQEVPFRVTRIVESMDMDDSGTVEITELSAFFETMQLIDGKGKGDPPKLQAEGLIEALTGQEGATSCSTKKLHDSLVRRFTKNPAMLEKIERSLLLIPVGAQVVIRPGGNDANNPMWQKYIGKTGSLASYYNESKWCYVELSDGEKVAFKTDVVVVNN